jgi:hypothetical protein
LENELLQRAALAIHSRIPAPQNQAGGAVSAVVGQQKNSLQMDWAV